MSLYSAVPTFAGADAFVSARHMARPAQARRSSSDHSSSVRRTVHAVPFKLQHVVVALCLNVGVRPPDALQSDDVASLEAWLSPAQLATKSPDEASELIAAALQAQLEAGIGRGAGRLRFKSLLDPTVDAILRHCHSLRSAALKRGQAAPTVLFLYNGHGTPAASDNGELWCFNDDYSQYIPLSLFSLQDVLHAPVVYIFDCARAGRLVRHYSAFCDERQRAELAESSSSTSVPQQLSRSQSSAASSLDSSTGEIVVAAAPPQAMPLSQRLRERSVILAACGADEVLPSNPALPADFFTACLTTPLKTLLFVASHVASTRSLMSAPFARGGALPAQCDVPGDLGDKATPLGFLDWLLTSVCDAIAYETVPLRRFQMLFREDIALAGLCRNFLVAQRLMGRYNVHPVAYPPLPDVSLHPLWSAFDAALEQVALHMSLTPAAPFEAPPFFEEQLCAAELALAVTPPRPVPLTTLPIVLQALLGAAHRGRALNWLARYFVADAHEATAHCLAIDALPYVAGLLRTRRVNLRRSLLLVWAQLVRCDARCGADLCAAPHGIAFMLDAYSALSSAAEATAAAFILATVAHRRDSLMMAAPRLAADAAQLMQSVVSPALRIWSALLVGELAAAAYPVPPSVQRALLELLHSDECPDARAAAAHALGVVLTTAPLEDALSLVVAMSAVASDASSLVRVEVLCALVRFVASLADGAVAAESVHACLTSVFELLERDPSPSVADVAAAARRLLLTRERAAAASALPPQSTFLEFARANACSADWVGGIASPLLALLADDDGNLLEPPASPRPGAARVGASSREPFNAAVDYWCAVRQLSTRVVDVRAPEHVAQLHNATPDELFRIRKRAQLEHYVGEWQRREATGERYVHESLLKAMKKSKASLAASTDNISPDDDEPPAMGAYLRHPPVRLDHDVASASLGKGAAPRALLLDSIRNECVFAASDGTVGVWPVAAPQVTSRFRVSAARAQPAASLALLNRRSSQPLLLAASLGDECVRVWRDYHSSTEQQLSAAWSLSLGGRVVSPAAAALPFTGAAAHARALAARVSLPVVVRKPREAPQSPKAPATSSASTGGAAASVDDTPLLTAWRQRSARLVVSCRQRVLLFDAHSERDVWHVDIPSANALTALHADYLGQRLIVGDVDGLVLLIDTRVRSEDAVVARLDGSRPAGMRRAQSAAVPLASLWRHSSDSVVRGDDSAAPSAAAAAAAAEPAEVGRAVELGVPTLRPHSLVAVHGSGVLRVWDLRAPTAAPFVGGRASERAVSCASVHERLPLVAVGSLAQRVWLYSTDGAMMHEIRNQRFASARIGAVSHARFDQFQPRIVLGAADGTISLHSDGATADQVE